MAFTPDTSSIKAPGETGLPPNLDSGSGGNLSDMIAKLMQPSAEEKSASKAREQATAAATDSLKNRSKDEAATTAELEKNMPTPEDFGLGKDELKAMEPGKSPSYKPDNPLQNFGSLATLIGVFGGMLTRHPVIASLNAASGAMKAAHERNIEDYEKQVEEWKNNQDYIGKVLAWREQMYGAADKKFANDLSARQAARTEIASRTQDTMTLQQITAGDEQRYYQTRMDSARLLQQMQENNERLKISSEELAERIRHDKSSENTGTIPKMAGQAAELRAKANQLPDGDPNKASLMTMADAIDKGISQTKGSEAPPPTLNQDAAKLIADSWLNGNRQAAVGFGRSPANQATIMNEIAAEAKEKNISGPMISALQAIYQGEVASQRTLGTRAANMEVAANEVDLMAPLALEASQKVDRTQFPRLNSIILAAEKGTGGENVVQFGLATNSLIYTYAKFLNPTGIPTDADKARASEILDTAWSKGQFSAAITQIKREIMSGQAAISSTKGEISKLVTGETSKENPATPSNKSDYDRLPPGAYYRKPDDPLGVVRLKP